MSMFMIPEHILTGAHALEESIPLLQKFGKKALIVTGKHVAKSVMIDELQEVLVSAGIQYAIYDGITKEPTDQMILKGVKQYVDSDCEFCIGIGGGSPLDSAKAIAAVICNGTDIGSFIGKEIHNTIPIVAIPTTAGTGSEATKFTVITDTAKNIKMLLKGEDLLPKLAVLQDDFGITAPKKVTAATGLDALTHAVEAYTSKQALPLTDVFAISSVKRIMKYLPVVYQNGLDKKARNEMSMAALEAGICINNSSVTLVHGMSRPIGALFHVPHGMSNAMLLPECLNFAKEGALQRFAVLGKAIEAADKEDDVQAAADKFIIKVGELCKLCEIPSPYEYGIKSEEFHKMIDKMAQDAVDSGSPGNTIRPVTKDDCKVIYKKIYK